MTILNDRVDYCVVKAGCTGPSFMMQTSAHGDRWACRRCNAFTVVGQNVVPAKPLTDAQSSR